MTDISVVVKLSENTFGLKTTHKAQYYSNNVIFCEGILFTQDILLTIKQAEYIIMETFSGKYYWFPVTICLTDNVDISEVKYNNQSYFGKYKYHIIIPNFKTKFD